MRIKIGIILGIGLAFAACAVATQAVHQKFIQGLTQSLVGQVTYPAAHPTFPFGVQIRQLQGGLDTSRVKGQSDASPLIGQSDVPLIKDEIPVPLSIDRLSARVSPPSLFTKNLRWDLRAEGLALNLQQDSEGKLHAPFALPWPDLFIRQLAVKDGILTFLDRKADPPRRWEIRGLHVTATPSRRLGVTTFRAEGSLQEGSSGWLGAFEMDGELLPSRILELTFVLRSASLENFRPYMHAALGTSPSSGRFTLRAQCTVHEGRLLAQAHLTASRVVFPTDEPTVIGPPGNRLVELLQDSEGQIRLDFLITGRLGEPWDWSHLATRALQESIRQALARSLERTLTEAEPFQVEEALRRGLESLGR